MLENNFKEALIIISKKLKNRRWAVIGSFNLVLQGMALQPNDLDVIVHLSELKNMQDLFQEYKPSAIQQLTPLGGHPSWAIKIKISGVTVQVLGEKSKGTYFSKLLKKRVLILRIDNTKIPCFTLDAESDAYAIKRKEKSRLIRSFIDNQVPNSAQK
ncbi:hypothetical protein C4573_04935 [Candidatus Woesearchaeota archaeon]|nr:MAG: hypothetical protein C4573_04935 [Candidatus Woesearchaeota archaeon]